jgi:hypothetical protein
MKRYTFNEQWLHIPNVELTAEEVEALRGKDEEKAQEARYAINERAKPISATSEEIDVLTDIYADHLPKMEEDDVFEFMSFNVAVGNNKAVGSFNYKLNGNHINVIIS